MYSNYIPNNHKWPYLVTEIKRCSGFSLAEVLCALTIMGILCSFIIPSLIQSVQDQLYKTAFKSIYSDIAGATTRILQDSQAGSLQNVFDPADLSTNMRTYYCKYLNCVKEFGWDSEGICASTGLKELDGDFANAITTRPCAILSNGATAVFNWNYEDASFRKWIFIDTNGLKGPNVIGQDGYFITIFRDGKILPYGYTGDYYNLDSGNGACRKNYTAFYAGYSCATKVLKGIDY